MEFLSATLPGPTKGVLVSLDNANALAASVADLAKNRTALSDLIQRATRGGESFNDESVFPHRSEMINEHLQPGQD